MLQSSPKLKLIHCRSVVRPASLLKFTRVMLDDLPPELIGSIIKYLRAESYGSKSLKALSLTARRFRQASQSGLFSTFHFAGWRKGTSEFLTSSPHLCEAVRFLKVYTTVFSITLSDDIWDTILSLLINLCGISFEFIGLSSCQIPPPLPTILQSSSVQLIHLEDVSLPFAFFSGCPNLKHLRLKDIRELDYRPVSQVTYTHYPILETLYLHLEISVFKIIATMIGQGSLGIDTSKIRQISLSAPSKKSANHSFVTNYAPHWKLLQYCAGSLRRVYFSPHFMDASLNPIDFSVLVELEEFVFDMVFFGERAEEQRTEDTPKAITEALRKMLPSNRIHTITIYTVFNELAPPKEFLGFNLSEWRHLDSVLRSSRFPLLSTVKVKIQSKSEKHLPMVIPEIQRLAPYLHGSGILQWETTDAVFQNCDTPHEFSDFYC